MDKLVKYFCILIFLSANSSADSWEDPEDFSISSRLGNAFVRVEIAKQNTPSKAKIFKFDETNDRYNHIKTLSLPNPVRPLEGMITEDAKFLITFDDYFGVGTGENVIVIHNIESGKSKSYSLRDFVTWDDIRNMPSSVSSDYWYTDTYFSPDEKLVYIRNYRDHNDYRDHSEPIPEFTVNLETMKIKTTYKQAEPQKMSLFSSSGRANYLLIVSAALNAVLIITVIAVASKRSKSA